MEQYKKLLNKDVMIDLETLGKRPGCVILSIGAVSFSRIHSVQDPGFYRVVNIESCERRGLTVDTNTIAWWNSQTAKAREVVQFAKSDLTSVMLKATLLMLNEYILSVAHKETRVWGNGPDFDIAILYAAYGVVGVKPAWRYHNSRCFRTLKDVSNVEPVHRQGVYHNALDDAKTQAYTASKAFRQMGNEKSLAKQCANQE